MKKGKRSLPLCEIKRWPAWMAKHNGKSWEVNDRREVCNCHSLDRKRRILMERESVQNRYIFIRLRGGFSPKIKDTLSLFSGEERKKKNFFRNPRGNLGLSFLPHLSRFKRAILGRERERPESPGPGDKYWSWDQREDFAKNIFKSILRQWMRVLLYLISANFKPNLCHECGDRTCYQKKIKYLHFRNTAWWLFRHAMLFRQALVIREALRCALSWMTLIVLCHFFKGF